MADVQKNFAFVFPMASGHVNPALPVARALVSAGHKVHFLCREPLRQAIESTGASFYLDADYQTELHSGREPVGVQVADMLVKERGLEKEPTVYAFAKVYSSALELALPGTLRWLQTVRADAIMYCALFSSEAAYAGKVLGVTSVGLMTTAGPGSWGIAMTEFFGQSGCSAEGLEDILLTYRPHLDAVRRLNEAYDLGLSGRENFAGEPVGCLTFNRHSEVVLVTTSAELQDPMTPEVEEAYASSGVVFEAVGPLLDKSGATRAAQGTVSCGAEVLSAAGAARAAGRSVVLVSMGTVLTKEPFWSLRPGGRGVSGRELCQGAWGGAFDAFGSRAGEGPLLLVAVGKKADALDGLEPPANAICAADLPQVDLLKAGVDLFLTHGGQNSFTEALAHGVPLVVCPGFADQPVNACKAQGLGVGLGVLRPDPDPGMEVAAMKQYREDVAASLTDVLSQERFLHAAASCGERLRLTAGVPRAVEVMFEASGKSRGTPLLGLAEMAAKQQV